MGWQPILGCFRLKISSVKNVDIGAGVGLNFGPVGFDPSLWLLKARRSDFSRPSMARARARLSGFIH